jgi:hypothetical protein
MISTRKFDGGLNENWMGVYGRDSVQYWDVILAQIKGERRAEGRRRGRRLQVTLVEMVSLKMGKGFIGDEIVNNHTWAISSIMTIHPECIEDKSNVSLQNETQDDGDIHMLHPCASNNM